MYAVIDDNQRQFKVEQGDRFEVELKDQEEGQDKVIFERILMIGGDESSRQIGRPVVDGAKVVASILGEVKGDKIVVQKFRRRKKYRRKTGHRQRYLQLRVDSIEI